MSDIFEVFLGDYHVVFVRSESHRNLSFNFYSQFLSYICESQLCCEPHTPKVQNKKFWTLNARSSIAIATVIFLPQLINCME